MQGLTRVGLAFVAAIELFQMTAFCAAGKQTTGILSGVALLAESRTPFTDGAAVVVEAKRGMILASDGSFRFEGLEPGNYKVIVRSICAAEELFVTAQVNAGETTYVELLVKGRGLTSAAASSESVGVEVPLKQGDMEFRIRAVRKELKLGDLPSFKVRITNRSRRAIRLVPHLDGSDRGRFPFVFMKIQDPDGDTIQDTGSGGFCGNLNGIGADDLVEVGPGEDFDPYMGGGGPYLQRIASPGRYTAVFHYSTNQPDMRKWLGWPPPDHLSEELSRRFRRVPLVDDSCSVEFVVRP